MSEGVKLILVRHGNTFAPGDRVVWAGSRENFPLVARGKQQAQECAEALQRAKLIPAAIYAGPLLRAQETAQIIAKVLGHAADVVCDERLNEIDYGCWGGLTQEEVLQQFGAQQLENWRERGIWPPPGIWGSSEAAFREEVRAFINDISALHAGAGPVLLVSSNGRLRYFLDLLPEHAAPPLAERGMKTGHYALMACSASGWRLDFWNRNPLTVTA